MTEHDNLLEQFRIENAGLYDNAQELRAHIRDLELENSSLAYRLERAEQENSHLAARLESAEMTLNQIRNLL